MTKNSLYQLQKKLKEVYELFNVKFFGGDLPKAYPRKWYEIFKSASHPIPFPYKEIDKTIRVKFSFQFVPKESFLMQVITSYGEWDKTILTGMVSRLFKTQLSESKEDVLHEYLKHDPDCYKPNSYKIIVNTSSSQFKSWIIKMKGFELSLLHEIHHIWIAERERKYVPCLTEDWESPFWDREDTTWDEYYISATILFGKLLSESTHTDIETLFKKYIRSHHLEYFIGCFTTADLLVRNPPPTAEAPRFDLGDIRRMFNIKLDKKLSLRKIFKMRDDLTNKLYGYTT